MSAGRSDFVLTGTVTSAVPVYALVAYLDPEGHDDYDARMAVAQPKADGTFAVRCGGLVAGRSGALRLCALLANGAVSRFQSEYRVAKDGTPDVAAMEVSFALVKFLAALEAGDLGQAGALRDALPANSRARRIATVLLATRTGNRKTYAAAAVPAESRA